MAKTSMKNRELKRQQTVAKYAKKRAELKATMLIRTPVRKRVGKPRSLCRSNHVTPALRACVTVAASPAVRTAFTASSVCRVTSCAKPPCAVTYRAW